MLNIIKNNDNVKLTFNTSKGVKTKEIEYKKILFKEVKNGDYTSLKGNKQYKLDDKGTIYPFSCFKENKNYDKGTYFNTVSKLPDDFINDLEFPKTVFYDIETNNQSIPINKGKYLEAPSTARINSISWINEDNEEYCLIVERDGTERDILKKFLEYLENNKIMSLVGHNSYGFDNIVMRDRLRQYDLNNDLFKTTTNQCNLDTLVLAKTLTYTNKMISLNDLASLLDIDESKIDLGVKNPINAYDEAVKTDNFDKFEEYNIQDVRLTKKVFEKMGAKDTLIELYKLTLCPFNKMNGVVNLLNYYTCRNLYKDKIIVPTNLNNKIKASNKGGFNYIESENELLRYKNITIYDVVSYYPNLFRLIKANNLEPYNNFNCDTGELKPFKDLKDGYLNKIATNLYFKRIEVKNLMKKEKDIVKKLQLNSKQQTLKIIVNGLYGACDSNYNYILGSHKISTIITTIGRNLLEKILKEFKGVYAKTDSIFIQTTDSESTLKDINEYTTKFLKETYNLNNIDDNNEPIIKFELDDKVNELIVKSKNEYIKKYENRKYKLKGGSLTGDNTSDFEKDLIKKFIIEKSNNNINIKEVLKFSDKAIETHNIDYFSFRYKLSSKTPNDKRAKGKSFMIKNNIPFNWNFKYKAVRVESDIYDWILYPTGYSNLDDLQISQHYVYELALKFLKNNKLITNKEFNQHIKNKYLHSLNCSINTYNKKKSELIKDLENNQTLNNNYYREAYKEIQKVEKREYKHLINNKSSKLDELKKTIKDTEDYIKSETIKIIPLNENRTPNYTRMQKYLEIDRFENKKHMKLIPSGKLIHGNENIGIATGYNNLKCIDIDGVKKKLTKKQNIQVCEDLKNILESTDIPFIIQKTKSKGYHLFYVSEETFNFNGFKFPKNYHIPELRDYEFGLNTIEVINNKPIPIAPTEVKNEGKYSLLSNKYTWDQIFSIKIPNIFDIIKEAFIKKGFIYKPPKINEPEYNYNTKFEIVEISENEIQTIINNSVKIFDYAIKKDKNVKNKIALALGGYLSKIINEDTAQIICDGISDKIGHEFKDIKSFENTFMQNWNNDKENKTGINTIRKLFNNSKEINKLTKKYHKNISEK